MATSRSAGSAKMIDARASMRAVGRVVQAIAAVVLGGATLIVLAGTVPMLFGLQSLAVYSGSMEPTLPVGSLAVMRPAPVSELRVGDVITYRTPAAPDVVVTHRLMAIDAGDDGRVRYRTKGDANSAEDVVQVEPYAVLGRLEFTIPIAGYIVEFGRSPRGRILLLGIPVLLLAADFVWTRARGAARQRSAVSDRSGNSRSQAELLSAGRDALERGDRVRAAKVADGVLAADPHDEDAWLLKAETLEKTEERIRLLQTALVVSPEAQRLNDALERLTRPGATSVAV